MKNPATSVSVEFLRNLIDEGFERKAWHGPSLRGSLRGLSPREASWRPRADRHNIHEITLHAAYWKYAVRRRLLGEKRGSFPLKGSNWFPSPRRLSGRQWKTDLALLAETHHRLQAAIAQPGGRGLRKTASGISARNLRMIAGIALHDVYHAGQIQILKRLMGK